MSLKGLEVQSFVTSVDPQQNKGGASIVCPTQDSCMDVMSCAPVQCSFTLRYCHDETAGICLTDVKVVGV